MAISGLKGDTSRFTVYLWSDHPLAAQDRAINALRKVFDPAKSEISIA